MWEIGRKLGVSSIVEGSVRRDREQVRVTAQLVVSLMASIFGPKPTIATGKRVRAPG